MFFHLNSILVLPQQLADHRAVGEAEQFRAHLLHLAVAEGDVGGGKVGGGRGQRTRDRLSAANHKKYEN